MTARLPALLAAAALGITLATGPGCAARPAAESPAAPAAAPPSAGGAADAASTAEAHPTAEQPTGKVLELEGQDAGDPMVSLADAEAALDRALASPKRVPAAAGDAPGSPARPQAAADPCAVACQALASMRRSAERLCDLAPPGGDHRCDDARARVTRAERRVQERCPACDDAPR